MSKSECVGLISVEHCTYPCLLPACGDGYRDSYMYMSCTPGVQTMYALNLCTISEQSGPLPLQQENSDNSGDTRTIS